MIAEQQRREERRKEERKRGRIALDNDADILRRRQNCSRLISTQFAFRSLSSIFIYNRGQRAETMSLLSMYVDCGCI